MTVRRFGPTLAAGVSVTEEPGDQISTPAQLGVTAYVGPCEKGKVGEVITALSKRDLLKKTGGLIDNYYLPQAAQDFWKYSNGAGVMNVVRVTDGNEEEAALTLYNRQDPRKAALSISAKNGGSWGGKKFYTIGVLAVSAVDNSAKTVQLPVLKNPKTHVVAVGTNIFEDMLVGATLKFDQLSGETFTIKANDEGDNTTGALVTLESDADLSAYTDGGDRGFTIEMANGDKSLSIVVKDGQLFPDDEFGLFAYLDGQLAYSYPDLSMDPASDRYVEDVINDDSGNLDFEVDDLNTGAVVAGVRPANHYSTIPTSGVNATQLTLDIIDPIYDVDNTGVANAHTFTYGTDVRPDVYTLTFTNATTYTVSSLFQDVTFSNGTTNTPYAAVNDASVGWTVSGGSPSWVSGDVITLEVFPLPADISGGRLFYNVTDEPNKSIAITANGFRTVTVGPGNDLTSLTSAGKLYRVEYQEECSYGYDGLAFPAGGDSVDDKIENYLDASTSPLNSLLTQNFGLIKLAAPGITSTQVQQAGAAYAEAKGLQWRYELPSNIYEDVAGAEHFENTLGRNDFAVGSIDSWVYIQNPSGAGLRLVPTVGMIHGKEALFAKNYNGYHKAAAGVDAAIAGIVKTQMGSVARNEEYLNPKGIGLIKKMNGNFVLWGDRSLSIDTSFRFKHKREVLSHYAQQLLQNFNQFIYMLNDEETANLLSVSLRAFFLPEYKKRALSGKNFEYACIIKVDSSINTNATRANGDLFAEVSLRIVDTVERVNFIISQQGIFETAAA